MMKYLLAISVCMTLLCSCGEDIEYPQKYVKTVDEIIDFQTYEKGLTTLLSIESSGQYKKFDDSLRVNLTSFVDMNTNLYSAIELLSDTQLSIDILTPAGVQSIHTEYTLDDDNFDLPFLENSGIKSLNEDDIIVCSEWALFASNSLSTLNIDFCDIGGVFQTASSFQNELQVGDTIATYFIHHRYSPE